MGIFAEAGIRLASGGGKAARAFVDDETLEEQGFIKFGQSGPLSDITRQEEDPGQRGAVARFARGAGETVGSVLEVFNTANRTIGAALETARRPDLKGFDGFQEAFKELEATGTGGVIRRSLEEAGVENKFILGAVQLGGDILLDPLTFTGIGTLTKAGRFAKLAKGADASTVARELNAAKAIAERKREFESLQALDFAEDLYRSQISGKKLDAFNKASAEAREKMLRPELDAIANAKDLQRAGANVEKIFGKQARVLQKKLDAVQYLETRGLSKELGENIVKQAEEGQWGIVTFGDIPFGQAGKPLFTNEANARIARSIKIGAKLLGANRALSLVKRAFVTGPELKKEKVVTTEDIDNLKAFIQENPELAKVGTLREVIRAKDIGEDFLNNTLRTAWTELRNKRQKLTEIGRDFGDEIQVTLRKVAEKHGVNQKDVYNGFIDVIEREGRIVGQESTEVQELLSVGQKIANDEMDKTLRLNKGEVPDDPNELLNVVRGREDEYVTQAPQSLFKDEEAFKSIANKWRGFTQSLQESEKNVGLIYGNVQGYFPRIMSQSAKRVFKVGGAKATRAKQLLGQFKQRSDEMLAEIGVPQEIAENIKNTIPGTSAWQAGVSAQANFAKNRKYFQMTNEINDEWMKEFGHPLFIQNPGVAIQLRSAEGAQMVATGKLIDTATKTIDQGGLATHVVRKGDLSDDGLNKLQFAFSSISSTHGAYIDIATARAILKKQKTPAATIEKVAPVASRRLKPLVSIQELQPHLKNGRKSIPDDARISFVDKEVVQEMNRVVAQENSPFRLKNIFPVIREFDKFQGIWKGWALFHPTWHFNNAVTNFITNKYANVGIEDYKDAMRVMWAQSKNSMVIERTRDLGKAINSPEGILRDSQILQEINNTAITGKGMWATEGLENFERFTQRGGEILRGGIGDTKKLFKGIVKEGNVTNVPKLMSRLIGSDSFIVQMNQYAGAQADNFYKIAHYIRKRKEGLTPLEASLSVKKFLFDYSDLTDVEQEFFKRIFPFYTWFRKNTALAAKLVLERPARPADIQNIKSAVEFVTSEDDQFDRRFLPEYLKKNMPVRLWRKEFTDKRTGEVVEMPTFIAMAKPIGLLNAISDWSVPQETAINMATPMVKVVAEVWANYDTFRKKPIVDEEAGRIKEDLLGIEINRKVAHVFKQVRPVQLIDQLVSPEVTRFGFEPGGADRALGFLTGIRQTPVDIELSKRFALIGAERAVREARTGARRAGRRAGVESVDFRSAKENLQRRIEELAEIRSAALGL